MNAPVLPCGVHADPASSSSAGLHRHLAEHRPHDEMFGTDEFRMHYFKVLQCKRVSPVIEPCGVQSPSCVVQALAHSTQPVRQPNAAAGAS
jgi:hypothetical protein